MNKVNKKRITAIWGYPNPDTITEIKAKFPNNIIVDLDIDYNYPSSGILPDAYCKIIRNIFDNAHHLKDSIDVIIASIGQEKCDAARFASLILKDKGFNVIETKFENYSNSEVSIPICTSNLPIEQKINAIMSGITSNQNLNLITTNPSFGFWGVPPNDMSFLKFFPPNTHIYGWVRCVEARRPADLDLEMYVDENIPTVFFSQTFCAKMQLAKYLAKKYNGLYIDIDDVATKSVKAKIEAFIKLR